MTPGCYLPECSRFVRLLFLAPVFSQVLSCHKLSGWAGAGLGTNAGVDSEQDPSLLPLRDFSTNSNGNFQPCSCVIKSGFTPNKLSGWVGAGLGTNAGVDSEHDPRLLSSREFLRELGKGAGARKELSALSLRWINLRGMPHITAAFTYNKYALTPAP